MLDPATLAKRMRVHDRKVSALLANHLQAITSAGEIVQRFEALAGHAALERSGNDSARALPVYPKKVGYRPVCNLVR